MTDAVLSPSKSSAAVSPWIVAAAVVAPTFTEVLDTTITLVALRYIAGGLSATVDDGDWVITSYLAANAIILPITRWWPRTSVGATTSCCRSPVFTLASALCGMATSLGPLIVFRVVQGLAGGGPLPAKACCWTPSLWEVMLSKGQEWDWMGDPFWRVQTLASFFGVGLIALILWELRHPSPVVNFRPMRERNFSASCLIIFRAYMVLYAASTSLPA